MISCLSLIWRSMRRTPFYVGLCCVPIILAGSEAGAYSGGPPDGYCGDPPGFHTCTACHSSFPLNSGDGLLLLQALPSEYTPNQPYTLVVNLTDPNQRRWGFEMTVIHPGDGLQAGTLASLDGTTQVSDGAGTLRDYIKQTLSGTFPNTDHGTWQLTWTAPASGSGPAHFYLAGNAANNNSNPSFDYIYALDLEIPERNPLSVDSGAVGSGPFRLSLCPNPPAPGARLDYSLPRDGSTEIRLIDASGRICRNLASGPARAGMHSLTWDALDNGGRPLASGVYSCVLTFDGAIRIIKVPVLRR